MSNVLTDEEINEIMSNHPANDYSGIFDLCRDIERAVLAKAGEQEPVGYRAKIAAYWEFFDDKEYADQQYAALKNAHELVDNCTARPSHWSPPEPVYAHQLPAQAENPLVDAVFAASHKKATDTHSKCPHCSHECEQAIPDGYVHVDDVIQLCKDFSSRNGSVYIGDVEAAISGLSASPGTPKV